MLHKCLLHGGCIHDTNKSKATQPSLRSLVLTVLIQAQLFPKVEKESISEGLALEGQGCQNTGDHNTELGESPVGASGPSRLPSQATQSTLRHQLTAPRQSF